MKLNSINKFVDYQGGAAVSFKQWFIDRAENIYRIGDVNDPDTWGWPWTRLGYTYDWGSSNHVGLSEFVIRIDPAQNGGELLVKPLHNGHSGGIIYVPRPSDHVARAGLQERPGEAEHGLFLYDSVLRIPWIMRLPAKDAAGNEARALPVACARRAAGRAILCYDGNQEGELFTKSSPDTPQKLSRFAPSGQTSGVARRDNLFGKGFPVTLSKTAGGSPAKTSSSV